MNRPTLASTPAISSPPPIGQPVAGSESRLAPPLPTQREERGEARKQTRGGAIGGVGF